MKLGRLNFNGYLALWYEKMQLSSIFDTFSLVRFVRMESIFDPILGKLETWNFYQKLRSA